MLSGTQRRVRHLTWGSEIECCHGCCHGMASVAALDCRLPAHRGGSSRGCRVAAQVSLLLIIPQAKEEGLAWPDEPEVNAGQDTLRRRS